jgi:hypothetical protein
MVADNHFTRNPPRPAPPVGGSSLKPETAPTLRDQFAMAALAYLANPNWIDDPDKVASQAYWIADAMLAHRLLKQA